MLGAGLHQCARNSGIGTGGRPVRGGRGVPSARPRPSRPQAPEGPVRSWPAPVRRDPPGCRRRGSRRARPSPVPRASVALNTKGGKRIPRPTRYPPYGPRTDSIGISDSRRIATYRRAARPETPNFSASRSAVMPGLLWMISSVSSARAVGLVSATEFSSIRKHNVRNDRSVRRRLRVPPGPDGSGFAEDQPDRSRTSRGVQPDARQSEYVRGGAPGLQPRDVQTDADVRALGEGELSTQIRSGAHRSGPDRGRRQGRGSPRPTTPPPDRPGGSPHRRSKHPASHNDRPPQRPAPTGATPR